MDSTYFPHTGVGPDDLHPELFIRDMDFLNYHINHNKWRWYLDYTFQNAVRWGDDFLFDEVDLYDIAMTGQGTEVVIDYINGVCILIAGPADDDYIEKFQENETWQLNDGFPLYLECRVKMSDADQADAYIGLINAGGYFAGNPQDGVYFIKYDGFPHLIFAYRTDGVTTEIDTGIDAADLTWIILAFHWDGDGNLRWFVFEDGPEPQLCLATGTVTSGYVQDELLRVAFGVRAGDTDSAGKLLYLDYWRVSMKRYMERGGI